MQGKFHVWEDAATKTKMVATPFQGAPPGTPLTSAIRLQSTAARNAAPLSLSALKSAVTEASR